MLVHWTSIVCCVHLSSPIAGCARWLSSGVLATSSSGMLWWNGGARRQRAYHQHSAAPLADFQMEFMRKTGSRSRGIGRMWADMILTGREDPHNCMDQQTLGKSEWDQKMGKLESVIRCMIKWYRMLSTPGSPKYILPVTPVISDIPLSLYPHLKSGLCQAEWRWLCATYYPPQCISTLLQVSFSLHPEVSWSWLLWVHLSPLFQSSL